jgi:hypothetical protein
MFGCASLSFATVRSIMPNGRILSIVLNKDRNPGPPGWGLAVQLKSNIVKTQMSGNTGVRSSGPKSGRGEEKKKNNNRKNFLSSIHN